MKSYSDDILSKTDISPTLAALQSRIQDNEQALARARRNLIITTVINSLVAVAAIIIALIH